MDYFYELDFPKGVITVLGADKTSDFVLSLAEHLKTKGTVLVTDKKAEISEKTDYTVLAPDEKCGKKFIVHSEADIAAYREKGKVIGVVSIEALLKDVKDSVIGAEYFCVLSDITENDLVYPLAIAKVITNREKYDMLYIDDISNEGRRYTAREISRRITYGAGVRIINTDTCFTEVLFVPSEGVL